MISYNASHYQVPPSVIGKKVLLKIKDGMIRFYDDDRLLATYDLSDQKGAYKTDIFITEQIRQLRQKQPRPFYHRVKGKATGVWSMPVYTPGSVQTPPVCPRRWPMEQLINDRLRDNLSRLKLTQAAEVLDVILKQAEVEKSSYMSFLDHLLEEEVAAKEKRRVQTAMKTAGLPCAKTIEEYDFAFHPNLNKKEVLSLFDLDFIRKHENAIGASRCGQDPSGCRSGHQGLLPWV
jgi:hypothetical protein